MMEDKLINNEETEKFKRAVDLFKGANYSAETMLRISLVFYFATKRVLQIFDAEKYTDNRGLATYMRELNTPPSLKSHEEYYILSSTSIPPYIQCESETGIRFLQVERKHIPSHIWECIDYVHDNTLLYSEYDKSTELDWRRNNLIYYAEVLISLSDKWYSENAINAFNYIQEIRSLDREFRNEIPFLPSNVAELIGELLGATDGYVYNPRAQFGEFIGVIDKGAIYHGEEDSVRAYIVQLRLLLEGRYNSKCDMGRTKNWEDLSNKYDFIVSNIPGPLGISFFINSSQNTLRKSVGIYTSDICFPTKMFHIKGVENLLKQDLIETVIQLPTEIFSNKQISTVIIVANKKKQQKGRVHLIDARDCYINKGECKVLDLNRIAIMLNDLGEHDHHKYISNESITNNNCNILPQTYNEIPTPKGFQLISLKQILTQSRINKTIANEGFLFTPKDAQPYKTSSYLELPQIDGVTVKIPETTVLSNSGEHVEQRLGGIVNDDFLAINSILL
ncbi:MAG: N-6 DNA methylase, partial [Prevotellamassilia sp.]|nr:N-6 DNA methylase [Prevotellamassilia sp.]